MKRHAFSKNKAQSASNLGFGAYVGRGCRGKSRKIWIFWPLSVLIPFFVLMGSSGRVDLCARDTRLCTAASLRAPSCGGGHIQCHPLLDGSHNPNLEAISTGPDQKPPNENGALHGRSFDLAALPLPFSMSTQSHHCYTLPPGKTMLDMATMGARISLDQAALIAVIEQNQRRHALVRLPDGRILRLQKGDILEGDTVAAIGENTLFLLTPDFSPRALILGG